MNRLLTILLVIWSWSMVSVATAKQNDTHASSSTAKPLRINARQPLLYLRIAANPTTGYQWFIQSFDHHLLTLVKQQYIVSKKPLIGAGGTEEIVFKAQAEALRGHFVTKIRLVYARPWDIQHGQSKVYFVVTE